MWENRAAGYACLQCLLFWGAWHAHHKIPAQSLFHSAPPAVGCVAALLNPPAPSSQMECAGCLQFCSPSKRRCQRDTDKLLAGRIHEWVLNRLLSGYKQAHHNQLDCSFCYRLAASLFQLVCGQAGVLFDEIEQRRDLHYTMETWQTEAGTATWLRIAFRQMGWVLRVAGSSCEAGRLGRF